MEMISNQSLSNIKRFSLSIFLVSCISCIEGNSNADKTKLVKIGNFKIEVNTDNQVFYASLDSLNGRVIFSKTKEMQFNTGYIVPVDMEGILILNDTDTACVKHLYKDVSKTDSVFVITAYNPLDKTNLFDTPRFNYLQMIVSNPDQQQQNELKKIFRTLHYYGEKM